MNTRKYEIGEGFMFTSGEYQVKSEDKFREKVLETLARIINRSTIDHSTCLSIRDKSKALLAKAKGKQADELSKLNAEVTKMTADDNSFNLISIYREACTEYNRIVKDKIFDHQILQVINGKAATWNKYLQGVKSQNKVFVVDRIEQDLRNERLERELADLMEKLKSGITDKKGLLTTDDDTVKEYHAIQKTVSEVKKPRGGHFNEENTLRRKKDYNDRLESLIRVLEVRIHACVSRYQDLYERLNMNLIECKYVQKQCMELDKKINQIFSIVGACQNKPSSNQLVLIREHRKELKDIIQSYSSISDINLSNSRNIEFDIMKVRSFILRGRGYLDRYEATFNNIYDLYKEVRRRERIRGIIVPTCKQQIDQLIIEFLNEKPNKDKKERVEPRVLQAVRQMHHYISVLPTDKFDESDVEKCRKILYQLDFGPTSTEESKIIALREASEYSKGFSDRIIVTRR